MAGAQGLGPRPTAFKELECKQSNRDSNYTLKKDAGIEIGGLTCSAGPSLYFSTSFPMVDLGSE